MKLVHAADLHLDSPLRGLERYEGAPVDAIRGATRRALENLVDLCLEERASLLLLAGDLFDGDWKDYATGLFFATQMTRLREGRTEVALVRGNHDAASHITRHLRLPDHVHELPTHRPGSHVFEDLGVAVHGQGFPRRAVLEDLVPSYPEPIRGLLNLGLLHTSVDGREGHEGYAPTSLEALRNKGYDYWALGHVHAREVLGRDPWVVFPGNLQGRHPREPGPKGATLVCVEEGAIQSVEHRSLDVVRWDTCVLDVSEAATAEDAVDLGRERIAQVAAEAEGRVLALRLRLAGVTPAHGALQDEPERWASELRLAAADAGSGLVWMERMELATQGPWDAEALARRDDPLGSLTRTLRELRGDPAALVGLAGELQELRRKLPANLRQGPDGLRLEEPDFVAGLLEDVEGLLLPRLLAGRREA